MYSYLIKESAPEVVEEFSASELEVLKSCYIEALEVLVDEDDDEEPLEEGVNIDILKAFKAFKKEYKQHIKGIKKAIKAGDEKEAKREIGEAKKVLDDVKKEIRKIPDDTESAVIGTILNFIITFLYLLLPAFGVHVGRAHGFWKGAGVTVLEIPASILFPEFAIPIRGIARLVKLSMQIVEEARYAKTPSDQAKLYNQFRLHILSIVEEYKSYLTTLENKINSK